MLKPLSHLGCCSVPLSPRSAPHHLVCLHAHYRCPTLLGSHASLIINLEASHLLYLFFFFLQTSSQAVVPKAAEEDPSVSRLKHKWILRRKHDGDARHQNRLTKQGRKRCGECRHFVAKECECRGLCIFNRTCRHSHVPVCLTFTSLALRLFSCFSSGILDKRKIMPFNTQIQSDSALKLVQRTNPLQTQKKMDAGNATVNLLQFVWSAFSWSFDLCYLRMIWLLRMNRTAVFDWLCAAHGI